MAKGKSPTFEKEKIIDRRIGIRLKSTFWPLGREAITEMLNKLNYKDLASTAMGSLSARKQNTDFYTDYSKLVFGFHNTTVNSLIDAQKEFFSVVHRDYKTDLNNSIRFYEIECLSNYISDKNVFEAISSASEGSQIKQDFEKRLGEQLQTSKLEFSRKGEGIQSNDWLTIEISPRLESAGNTYFCRLLSRDTSMQPLYQLLRKSSEIFENLVSDIEK